MKLPRRVNNKTGQVFGQLTVLSFAGVDQKLKRSMWLCQCECGKKATVMSIHLSIGSTKSCGCLRYNMYDKTGQVFGKLTVLSFAGVGDRKKSMWLCQCECGNKATVMSTHLSRGSTKSCGCLRGNSVKDRLGRKYGKLTVLSLHSVGVAGSRWLCKCECGNNTLVNGSNLTSGGTKTCGCSKTVDVYATRKDYYIPVVQEDKEPNIDLEEPVVCSYDYEMHPSEESSTPRSGALVNSESIRFILEKAHSTGYPYDYINENYESDEPLKEKLLDRLQELRDSGLSTTGFLRA